MQATWKTLHILEHLTPPRYRAFVGRFDGAKYEEIFNIYNLNTWIKNVPEIVDV